MAAIFWIIFTALTLLAQVNLISSQKTSSKCKADCRIYGGYGPNDPQIYGWFEDSGNDLENGIFRIPETATATILSVINTVLNNTSVTTLRPQSTNAAGTAIQIITYTRYKTTLTTTIAFPTFFFVWPDNFEWGGVLLTRDGASGVNKCVTAESVTVALPSFPQPTESSDIDRMYHLIGANLSTMTDLSGLSYSRLRNQNDGAWHYGVFSDSFPNQAALTTCTNTIPGPHWGGFTKLYWDTTSTTTYVGDFTTIAVSSSKADTPASTSSGAEQAPTRTKSWSSDIPPPSSQAGDQSDSSSLSTASTAVTKSIIIITTMEWETTTDATGATRSFQVGGQVSSSGLPAANTVVTKSIIVVATVGWTTLTDTAREGSLVPIVSTFTSHTTLGTIMESSTAAPKPLMRPASNGYTNMPGFPFIAITFLIIAII